MFYKLGKAQATLKGDGHFIAPNAAVIGDVTLEAKVNIWFNVVLRADFDRIVIGAGSSVQDGSVLHVEPGFPLIIGQNVTIGHMATLHSCNIGGGSLVGINAVVLNNARIGKNCLIGAHTLVPEGMVVPDGSLFVGSPGRICKELDEKSLSLLKQGVQDYVANGHRFNADLFEDPRD